MKLGHCYGPLLAALVVATPARARDDDWFSDLERDSMVRRTRIDVAGPEPASFTALGVAPFLTAQSLVSSDLAFSAAQVVDDRGHPRGALGVDFEPLPLGDPQMDLHDYQHSHAERFVSRIQLSFAASKGESDDDRTTHLAPTLRLVIHEQRDPLVHRGPGSLKDCFLRRIEVPPEAGRARQAALAAQLRELESKLETEVSAGGLDDAALAAAVQRHDDLQAQWQAGDREYRAALQQVAREGMKLCRDDPEVAAYTWNATGHAFGLSPSFRDRADRLGSIEPHGLVAFLGTAYGFDGRGTRSDYVPSFLGAHAQVLGQLLYRRNEPLPDPRAGSRGPQVYADADQLVGSLRLRGGTSPWNGDVEAAVLHDRFDGHDDDTYYRLALGTDAHVGRGTWLSFSVGRSFWRDGLSDETSLGLSLKKSLLD